MQTGTGGEECMSGTTTVAWPPAAMQGTTTVSDQCVQNSPGGGCELVCFPPSGATGTSSITAYTVTPTGFSGTLQSPVDATDGGVVCTYTFSATKM